MKAPAKKQRGRPALPPEEAQTALIRERVTEAERSKYERLGGKGWLRAALNCVRAEMDDRVPASVQLARVMAAVDEPDFADRHVQLGKFYGAPNVDALVDAMEGHIARLQEKVQMMRLPQPSALLEHVREG